MILEEEKVEAKSLRPHPAVN